MTPKIPREPITGVSKSNNLLDLHWFELIKQNVFKGWGGLFKLIYACSYVGYEFQMLGWRSIQFESSFEYVPYKRRAVSFGVLLWSQSKKNSSYSVPKTKMVWDSNIWPVGWHYIELNTLSPTHGYFLERNRLDLSWANPIQLSTLVNQTQQVRVWRHSLTKNPLRR